MTCHRILHSTGFIRWLTWLVTEYYIAPIYNIYTRVTHRNRLPFWSTCIHHKNSVIRVIQSYVFYVVFYGQLFVSLHFFCLPFVFIYLSFCDLHLITPFCLPFVFIYLSFCDLLLITPFCLPFVFIYLSFCDLHLITHFCFPFIFIYLSFCDLHLITPFCLPFVFIYLSFCDLHLITPFCLPFVFIYLSFCDLFSM